MNATLPTTRLAILRRSLSVTLLILAWIGLQPAVAQGQLPLVGTLAAIGDDGNVYLVDSIGGEPSALTRDARSGVRRYHWPTWSTDGRLAFFSQELSPAGGIRLKVFILEAGERAPTLAYQGDGETLTYAYWAPANCSLSANCRDLAVLTTTPAGLSVLRIRDQAPAFTAERIGYGSPFYYSYSPDATRMIWQRYGSQLDLYDTERDEVIARLPDAVGRFQAPMWSPVDDRLLFSVINESGGHDLVIADGQERQIIAANQSGALWFAWSPDARHVAYKADLDALHVVEVATGQEVARSPLPRVLAFFWSPDSARLAYLTFPDENAPQVRLPTGVRVGGGLAAPARQTAPPPLTWHVLDLATGSHRTVFRAFLPTREMLYLLTFFDQFAQSHPVWSPDGRYLAYAGFSEQGAPTVYLLDTAGQDAAPLVLLEGWIGIWSYR